MVSPPKKPFRFYIWFNILLLVVLALEVFMGISELNRTSSTGSEEFSQLVSTLKSETTFQHSLWLGIFRLVYIIALLMTLTRNRREPAKAIKLTVMITFLASVIPLVAHSFAPSGWYHLGFTRLALIILMLMALFLVRKKA